MICPLSFDCVQTSNQECVNLYYCKDLTTAWQLPYWIAENTTTLPPGTLLVTLVDYEDYPDNDYVSEYQLREIDEYNQVISYKLNEYQQAGWYESERLPYEYNEKCKATFVVEDVSIDDYGRFHPPVSIDWKKDVDWLDKDEYGYVADAWMVFDEDDVYFLSM